MGFDSDYLIIAILCVVFLACLLLLLRALWNALRSLSRPRHTPPSVRVPPASSSPPSLPGGITRPVPALGAIAAKSTKLDLDVTQFTPLSEGELRAAAQSAGDLFANRMLFGRRDLIPPADDPRTNLIDRGMVAHGLITPEQLTQIHDVGREMDQVRPDMASAGHVAQRAVQQDRADRAKLREQKKAAAVERKRRHAEDVARRKATDIIFLGRGVSKDLADRRADVEKLSAGGLPVLASPSDLSKALGLEIPRLRWLAYHSDAAMISHYIYFTIPKKSGGVRQLAAPHETLAVAQEWILHNILEKIPTHDAAHGFVKGRSTVTNATMHVGKDLVLNADLKDFFPSITFWRVAGVFRELGYSPAVASILGLLCTESPRRLVEYNGRPIFVATGDRSLPQGACTSPALSNLVSRRLDSRLRGIATKLGWTYTRYADDLSFSTDGDAGKQIGYLLARIRHIAQDEGFAVNQSKTRVLRKSTAQSVTGITVNDKPSVGRNLIRRLRAILHRARTEGLAAQNREKIPHFNAWLRGMIAYVQMVDPEQGRKLRDALAALG
jgi:retron-type reverse transcriptase